MEIKEAPHLGPVGINSPGYGPDQGVTEDGVRPWPGYKGDLFSSVTGKKIENEADLWTAEYYAKLFAGRTTDSKGINTRTNNG